MVILQPVDWIENDEKFKYIVDVFGRTDRGEVAQVRLTGFQPYFYIKYDGYESHFKLIAALEAKSNELNGKYQNFRPADFTRVKFTLEAKLDAMSGFVELVPIKVWKLTCSSLRTFKQISRAAKSLDVCSYEEGLPPFIRIFHEMDLSPASPFEFEADDYVPDNGVNADAFYEINYDKIKPATSINIPLLIAAYDLETYSSHQGKFPVPTNQDDEIMQVGISFRYTNDLLTNVKRIVFVSGSVESSKDSSVTFIACEGEKNLLEKFHECIRAENPDIIAGYNTFGFDDGYIAERCKIRNLRLNNFGRIDNNSWKSSREHLETERKNFELASGKFAVRYLEVPGRLSVDLLLSVRREQNLDSYKLDNVANTFLRDKVTNFVVGASPHEYEVHTKSTRGLFAGNLVRFDIIGNTINPYANGMKFKVKEVYSKKFIIELEEHNYLYTFDISAEDKKNLEWSFGKDDITAKEMFASHHGTSEQRSVVAKYCIQDCDLVLTLMAKLDTIVNARGMADVCRVPIQYIFLRGQGIKIYSAVVYNASKRNQIIMTQEGLEDDMTYEGAIVLPPKIGMYLNQPIPVLDFNSLYPSNMIAYNLSPDTLVYVKTYDQYGKRKKLPQEEDNEISTDKYKVDEVGYDIYDENKNPCGRTVCGFVQPNDDPRTIGILPLTLDILLRKRKETRKIMESIEDESQKSVLNGLQLAYKVVANSVYGQCGSRTSPIRRMEVAACTTATGRERIQFAKTIVETEFGGEVIYGDTDSIFIKFPTTDLAESMELGRKSAERITSLCRKAHKIEYEKTFFPFILFCRKRYVGMMYEDDVTKCKRKTMGIALKRRDNAPIVKDIFGGALDILMDKRDIRPAQTFVKEMLLQVLQNKVPLEKFIITKQLRDDYKNPSQIAHRVLADRMEERDAGNAPQVGDRLPYIYVENRKSEKKQGERIEHIDYVREKGLKPDTEFYITNQIQNPVAQLFALAIEQLEGYIPKNNYEKLFSEYLETFDEEKATLKVLEKKEQELESILFMKANYILRAQGKPVQQTMHSYFRK